MLIFPENTSSNFLNITGPSWEQIQAHRTQYHCLKYSFENMHLV